MTQTVESTEPVPAELRVLTGEAADITGVHPRTIERYVEGGLLRGGRPIDPVTHLPRPRSWRWVYVVDAVAMAVDRGRGHLVPDRWRHLIPQQTPPTT